MSNPQCDPYNRQRRGAAPGPNPIHPSSRTTTRDNYSETEVESNAEQSSLLDDFEDQEDYLGFGTYNFGGGSRNNSKINPAQSNFRSLQEQQQATQLQSGSPAGRSVNPFFNKARLQLPKNTVTGEQISQWLLKLGFCHSYEDCVVAIKILLKDEFLLPFNYNSGSGDLLQSATKSYYSQHFYRPTGAAPASTTRDSRGDGTRFEDDEEEDLVVTDELLATSQDHAAGNNNNNSNSTPPTTGPQSLRRENQERRGFLERSIIEPVLHSIFVGADDSGSSSSEDEPKITASSTSYMSALWGFCRRNPLPGSGAFAKNLNVRLYHINHVVGHAMTNKNKTNLNKRVNKPQMVKLGKSLENTIVVEVNNRSQTCSSTFGGSASQQRNYTSLINDEKENCFHIEDLPYLYHILSTALGWNVNSFFRDRNAAAPAEDVELAPSENGKGSTRSQHSSPSTIAGTTTVLAQQTAFFTYKTVPILDSLQEERHLLEPDNASTTRTTHVTPRTIHTTADKNRNELLPDLLNDANESKDRENSKESAKSLTSTSQHQPAQTNYSESEGMLTARDEILADSMNHVQAQASSGADEQSQEEMLTAREEFSQFGPRGEELRGSFGDIPEEFSPVKRNISAAGSTSPFFDRSSSRISSDNFLRYNTPLSLVAHGKVVEFSKKVDFLEPNGVRKSKLQLKLREDYSELDPQSNPSFGQGAPGHLFTFCKVPNQDLLYDDINPHHVGSLRGYYGGGTSGGPCTQSTTATSGSEASERGRNNYRGTTSPSEINDVIHYGDLLLLQPKVAKASDELDFQNFGTYCMLVSARFGVSGPVDLSDEFNSGVILLTSNAVIKDPDIDEHATASVPLVPTDLTALSLIKRNAIRLGGYIGFYSDGTVNYLEPQTATNKDAASSGGSTLFTKTTTVDQRILHQLVPSTFQILPATSRSRSQQHYQHFGNNGNHSASSTSPALQQLPDATSFESFYSVGSENFYNGNHRDGAMVSSSTTTSSTQEETTTFSLLVYNIWMMPKLLTDWLPKALNLSPGKFYRSRLIPHKIPKTDVLVFCEAFCDLEMDLIGQILRKQYGYCYDTVAPLSAILNSGVKIYSKHKILKAESKIFEKWSGDEGAASKGVTYAEIVMHQKSFHVFAAHLQAWESANAVKARESQILEIHDFIQAQDIPETEPVFIVGDLNIDFFDRSGEYEFLISSLDADNYLNNSIWQTYQKTTRPGFPPSRMTPNAAARVEKKVQQYYAKSMVAAGGEEVKQLETDHLLKNNEEENSDGMINSNDEEEAEEIITTKPATEMGMDALSSVKILTKTSPAKNKNLKTTVGGPSGGMPSQGEGEDEENLLNADFATDATTGRSSKKEKKKKSSAKKSEGDNSHPVVSSSSGLLNDKTSGNKQNMNQRAKENEVFSSPLFHDRFVEVGNLAENKSPVSGSTSSSTRTTSKQQNSCTKPHLLPHDWAFSVDPALNQWMQLGSISADDKAQCLDHILVSRRHLQPKLVSSRDHQDPAVVPSGAQAAVNTVKVLRLRAREDEAFPHDAATGANTTTSGGDGNSGRSKNAVAPEIMSRDENNSTNNSLSPSKGSRAARRKDGIEVMEMRDLSDHFPIMGTFRF
ncbi:unnamed protein product [Amoebophrya sp. A120]|nr:unnamed protein product [Amoebophrya sp. A120]|eukprot:GSA120T00009825001.1